MACLAVLGVVGIGGLAAGLTARAGLVPASLTSAGLMAASLAPEGSTTIVAATVADMPASDIVNLRFPHEWAEPAPAAEAAPKVLAFAGDGRSFALLSPRPFYPIPDVNAPVAYAPTAYAPTAYAPSAEAPAVEPPWAAEAPAVAKPVGQPKIALASTTSKPALAPSKPAVRSNAVLNDSQIASIKKRLNLRPDQERYWPAVEAELRKMEYKKDKSGQVSRTAQIDMAKVDVEGLKSAGFPLVMSFNEEQRRELKSLAHLLGLDGVMSSL